MDDGGVCGSALFIDLFRFDGPGRELVKITGGKFEVELCICSVALFVHFKIIYFGLKYPVDDIIELIDIDRH